MRRNQPCKGLREGHPKEREQQEQSPQSRKDLGLLKAQRRGGLLVQRKRGRVGEQGGTLKAGVGSHYTGRRWKVLGRGTAWSYLRFKFTLPSCEKPAWKGEE